MQTVPSSHSLHASERGQVMGGIQGCGVCGPMFLGSSPNSVMVVGTFPNYRNKLTTLMKDAGMDLRTFFVANNTRCLTHLRAQIHLCDPEWVLLLGADALLTVGYLREKITQVHGRPFKALAGPYRDRTCFPSFLPGGEHEDDKRANDIAQDLSTFSALVRGTLTTEKVEFRVGRKGKVAYA